MPRVVILVSVCLALVMVACTAGGRPSGSAPTGSAPAAGAPATSGDAAGARPAWQAEWDRVLAAAKQEKTVVVYGPPGDLIRRGLIDGFRKAYPDITVEWTAARPPELAAKLDAERRGGIYSVDVFLGGTTTALTLVRPMGALGDIKPALILSEVTEGSNWRGGRLHFSDRAEQNLVFINQSSTLAAYHPDFVRAADVDELYKLLDPRWKDKIAINSPLTPGAGNVTFRYFWQVLGPERGAEFIRALRAQAGAVDRDERRQVEWVARNRFPIVIGPGDLTMQQLREEGVRVEGISTFKDYGGLVTASAGSAMFINNAPHPNAAKVFLNWVLGKDGQTAWSTASTQLSLRADVPTDHLRPELVPQPGGKYWLSYKEDDVETPPALTTLLNEVFSGS
jgi:iron(III) transport system substrate-binding protein